MEIRIETEHGKRVAVIEKDGERMVITKDEAEEIRRELFLL